MARPALTLPTAPRTKVFRTLVALLRSDPTLKSVGVKWKAWTGDEKDAADAVESECPCIRISPSPNQPGNGWYSPDRQEADFAIQVELWTAGWNVDDASNLWGAVERAIYPRDEDAKLAVIMKFQEAGLGASGLVRFANAAAAPSQASDGVMYASGLVSIQVLIPS